MKGFTLVEVVVVLAIMMILAGLGIYGIISYRSTVELNTVYSDLTSAIKKQKNKASNSVAYNPSAQTEGFIAPDFYAIGFVNNYYDYYICNQLSLSNIINCEKDLTSEVVNGSSDVVISSTCSGFAFSLITTDIVQIDSAALSSSGTFNQNPTPRSCTITISHNLANISKTLEVDIVNDILNL